MAQISVAAQAPPGRALSRKAAIVGVGETDYGDDYRAERARAPGYAPPSIEALMTTAFERALAHAGLHREDIDGLTTSYIYGGPSPQETAGFLGLAPRFAMANGNIMAGPLPVPYDTILVELAEGPLFLSNPQGFDCHAAQVGMPLELRFLDCEDSAGRFSLPVFELA